MRMYFRWIISLSLLIPVSGRADLLTAHFLQQKAEHEVFWTELFENLGFDSFSNPISEQWFDQRIDHTRTQLTGTFRQKYFVDASAALHSDAPVFLYICGEASCRKPSGMVRETALRSKAIVVAVEHRYYGASQPFASLSPQHLKFLSVEQALADLASIQKHLQESLGLKGPWIAVGGSYAGALAAFYRQKFPQLVTGALASSGPVIADDNFDEYDAHVTTVAGQICAENIRKVVARAEEAVERPDEFALLRRLFEAEALTDPVDFLYLLADMAALAVQYGYKDRFCEMIQSGDPMEGYAEFTREIFKSWGINALSMFAVGGMSEDPRDYPEVGIRQWFYQSCTEFGFWQNAAEDPLKSVRSKRINPAYHRSLCQRLFGFTDQLDVQKTNQKYYEPLLNVATSEVLFTNGSQDPWLKLSITPESKVHDGITPYVIQGAAHCDDLQGESSKENESMKGARTLWNQKVQKWSHQ